MSEKRMSELSPEAQAILRAGVASDGPTDADRDRVRSALMATIAAGGAATAATATAEAATSSVSAAASAGASAGLATKLTIAIALVVGGGTGIYIANSTGDDEPASKTAPAIERPGPAAATEPEQTSIVESESATVIAPTPSVDAPKVEAPSSKPAAARRLQATETSPTASKYGSDEVEQLEQERKLLDLAGEALRRGNPSRALALLDESATLFPNARLAQEHSASRILALCALGRNTQASTAFDHFVARYPASAHITRINRACGDL